MTDLIVAGQVWRAASGAMSVVVGLEAPEDTDAIYATLVEFYDNGLLAGHARIECDDLRERGTLIYDLTMTMPWRI